MLPDPKAKVTPGGICLTQDEDGKQKGVISITSQEGSRLLLYKLKTNAPMKYVVRQSVGILVPGQRREITVRPKTGSDNADDKFQLEIRTAATSELDTLRDFVATRDPTKYDDTERDLVSKMWKDVKEEVARSQYLLLLQEKRDVKDEAFPKKKAADVNREYQARTEGPKVDGVRQMMEEKERLEQQRSEKETEIATLKEAVSGKVAVNGKAKSPKTPPLTVPLWLSILLIILSFAAGVFISHTANDSNYTPSAHLTEYLQYLQRPLKMHG